ncbi:MAG: TlpA disulfide reductase family protein [Gammaproteobacteria bacterium]|nr:TlpA disulfide reductase family protein [Gammaproteobacteria bacterium]
MRLIVGIPILLVLSIVSYVYASSTANFSLSDLNGKEYSLTDYRGKWVVVNYWATWCPPCVEEIPELIFFNDANKDKNTVVLGVDFEELPTEKVSEFLEEYMVNYPILLAEPEPYTELGRIEGLPTTFIVAPNGKVVHKTTGKVNAAYLESVIKEYKHRLGMTTLN